MLYIPLLFLTTASIPHLAQGTFDNFTIFQSAADSNEGIENIEILATPGDHYQLCNALNAGTTYNVPDVNTSDAVDFSFTVCNGIEFDFYGSLSSGGIADYEYYLHDAPTSKLFGTCNSTLQGVDVPCTSEAGVASDNTIWLNCVSSYNIC
jgi:hypothetical protein